MLERWLRGPKVGGSNPARVRRACMCDKSHTKEPTFRKMEVMGKRGQENGPKAEKDKTERATGL